jgi:DNA-binding CsgD family transcriptional regulator
MPAFEAERGAAIVAEILQFMQGAFSASAAILCWTNNSEEPEIAGNCGLSGRYLTDYTAQGIAANDPISAMKTIERMRPINRLSDFQIQPTPDFNRYKQFLANYGFSDEIDLLFRASNAPVAILGILKDEGCFDTSSNQLKSLHRFLEHNLSFHPKVKKRRRETILQTHFNLTSREVEVAELLQTGATNAEVAEILGIGMAPTPTHVLKIFDKIGVDCRAALVAVASQL